MKKYWAKRKDRRNRKRNPNWRVAMWAKHDRYWKLKLWKNAGGINQ